MEDKIKPIEARVKSTLHPELSALLVNVTVGLADPKKERFIVDLCDLVFRMGDDPTNSFEVRDSALAFIAACAREFAYRPSQPSSELKRIANACEQARTESFSALRGVHEFRKVFQLYESPPGGFGCLVTPSHDFDFL